MDCKYLINIIIIKEIEDTNKQNAAKKNLVGSLKNIIENSILEKLKDN